MFFSFSLCGLVIDIYIHTQFMQRKDIQLSFSSFFQHFQRDIVRGVEGYTVTGSKQVEIGMLVYSSDSMYLLLFL